jgi:hypothetical protein
VTDEQYACEFAVPPAGGRQGMEAVMSRLFRAHIEINVLFVHAGYGGPGSRR